jgi:hypothetical protein
MYQCRPAIRRNTIQLVEMNPLIVNRGTWLIVCRQHALVSINEIALCLLPGSKEAIRSNITPGPERTARLSANGLETAYSAILTSAYA